MNRQKLSIFRIIAILMGSLLMSQPTIWAQLTTMETTDEDPYVLTDMEVEQLLIHEGIPNLELNTFYQSDSKYTLGVGDVIEVKVNRHPEVSGSYVINSEGTIQYEFVGDVEIVGFTKQEVADKLTETLNKYIISPELNIKIIGYNSKIVYVVGEVRSPGKIFMRGDTITVREALVQAGLPLITAKTTKGKVITPTDDGRPGLKNVNINSLLYKGDLRENLVMEPGDTLFIPPTFLAKTMRAINPVTQPIGAAAGTGRSIKGF